ncbi:hypothetical protein T265_01938 [Opisthorchis viverrini]|uniref:Uncharacterized protein n=1 Tax=Opisthorchis viverrini TaxID=6198 RepID=A0A075A0S8_OPIVI|nr:hypothetical protein T265_01938 [Opisthorchis viverrini]KER31847.1 hypothetical protein T265_01938 [Opisthorchis viverrini]
MRRPGAAHSVAWKHHKREVQLGSRCHSNECIFANFVQFGFKQLNVLHQVASCFSPYDIRDIAIHVNI